MNRTTGVVAPMATVASALVLLAACSSSPHQATETHLKTVAIASSDLPFGWAASPPSTDNSVTAPCAALTSSAASRLPAQAESDFQASEGGPFVQENLASGTAQQVHDLWASVRKSANQCPATQLSATSFSSYGDESYALQLNANRSGVAYSGYVVVIRKGQVCIEVAVFGLGGVSTSLVQQLVNKAAHKV